MTLGLLGEDFNAVEYLRWIAALESDEGSKTAR